MILFISLAIKFYRLQHNSMSAVDQILVQTRKGPKIALILRIKFVVLLLLVSAYYSDSVLSQ